MNDFVEELVNHRKFMDMAEEEVDDKLMDQKKGTPKAIPYALHWLDPLLHPGYASLRFIGSITPRSHVIGISPKGFSWGTNTFPVLDRLINEFKRNPRGTPKQKDTLPAQPKAQAKNRWGAKPPPPPQQAPAPPQWQPQQQQQPPPPQQQAYPPQYAPQPYAQPQSYAPSYQGYAPQGGYAANTGWDQSYYPPAQSYHQPPPYQQPQHALPQRPPPPANPPPPPRPPQQPPPPAFDVPEGGAAQGRGRGRTLPAWMSQK
jgi:hypothetical protein